MLAGHFQGHGLFLPPRKIDSHQKRGIDVLTLFNHGLWVSQHLGKRLIFIINGWELQESRSCPQQIGLSQFRE